MRLVRVFLFVKILELQLDHVRGRFGTNLKRCLGEHVRDPVIMLNRPAHTGIPPQFPGSQFVPHRVIGAVTLVDGGFQRLPQFADG